MSFRIAYWQICYFALTFKFKVPNKVQTFLLKLAVPGLKFSLSYREGMLVHDRNIHGNKIVVNNIFSLPMSEHLSDTSKRRSTFSSLQKQTLVADKISEKSRTLVEKCSKYVQSRCWKSGL